MHKQIQKGTWVGGKGLFFSWMWKGTDFPGEVMQAYSHHNHSQGPGCPRKKEFLIYFTEWRPSGILVRRLCPLLWCMEGTALMVILRGLEQLM